MSIYARASCKQLGELVHSLPFQKLHSYGRYSLFGQRLWPLKVLLQILFLFVCIMNERTNPSAKFSQVFRPYRPIFKILGDEKGMETENETKHSYLSFKTNKNVTISMYYLYSHIRLDFKKIPT